MPATLVIRGGSVVDGTGAPARVADVVVDRDRITHVGPLDTVPDAEVVDATGLTVCPGFINVLSHAWGSLQTDPTGASDLLQGVTTEVFGEAFSLGPGDERMAEAIKPWAEMARGARLEFDRLSDGLSYLESKGVAPNITSFIGGENLRVMAAGFDDRELTAEELDRTVAIVAEEMQDGALGIGTALIYPPGRFARTDELVALCVPVGEHGGTYISHMRSEGDQFLECLDELLLIGERAGCRVEAFHLKAAGQHNWHKMKLAIERIDLARQAGRAVSANMYPYTAGGTALMASIPPRFHVGGPSAVVERLADPDQRRQMVAEISERSDEFENLYLGSGPDGILFFEDLADGTRMKGRRLSEVAEDLGLDPIEALLEIVAREPSTGAGYFMMSEDNVRLGLSQPWVSIGSDAEAYTAEPPYTDSAAHPRTYGTFARVLGHYCRDEGLFPLTEAVRRMTSLPADNFNLASRGRVEAGAFADLVVLDPTTVIDRATYAEPHQYSVGVRDVFVNGTSVVRDGATTGATPGRRLRRGRD